MQEKRKRRALRLRDEEKIERAILALVLEINRIYRTIPELGREFGKRAVNRAVEALIASELLELHGNTLMPTRAAVRFMELDW